MDNTAQRASREAAGGSQDRRRRRVPVLAVMLALAYLAVAMFPAARARADAAPDADAGSVEVEVEGGAIWQSRNDVQIPNDADGTRFALDSLVGGGPWGAGRLTLTWNVGNKDAVRLVAAPLEITETGMLDGPVDFAGERFDATALVTGSYRFNSWRIGYRRRLVDGARWDVWLGGTAKLRDAKVALRQGDLYAEDTDLGFVPLLYVRVRGHLGDRWSVLVELDALAGGPGRAIDGVVGLERGLGDRLRASVRYRTLEGGADVSSVYNFAWFHYLVGALSVTF